ncbi:Crp/Fnr family transcriptional regulator, partial [Vibrio vulnificus]|nr:Crp/Fnr family transcriptional regulator [Vibrio vulnificus]
AVKELMDKGLVSKGENGLEIVDEEQLRRFLEGSE